MKDEDKTPDTPRLHTNIGKGQLIMAHGGGRGGGGRGTGRGGGGRSYTGRGWAKLSPFVQPNTTTIEEVDPARVTPSHSMTTDTTLAVSQSSSTTGPGTVVLNSSQLDEVFERVSERLGVNQIREEVAQLQVQNIELQARLEAYTLSIRE